MFVHASRKHLREDVNHLLLHASSNMMQHHVCGGSFKMVQYTINYVGNCKEWTLVRHLEDRKKDVGVWDTAQLALVM